MIKTCPHGKAMEFNCIVCAKMFDIEDRLREENARLREALRFLAYAVSPDPKNLEPDWRVLSYEPHFAGSMEMARHALGVKLGDSS